MKKLNKSGIKALLAPFRWLIMQGVLFFLCSWNLLVIRFWIYFIITFLMTLVASIIMVKKAPELLNQRGSINEGTKKWDLFLLVPYLIFFLYGVPIAAGLDLRFNISLLSITTIIPGLLLNIVSVLIIYTSMMQNKHFEGTVRIQSDRDHRVITDGLYRIVRHPGYIGMLLNNIALPLIFGSLISFIPAVLSAIFLIIRTYLEDRTLQNELNGYKEYCNRTKYRLLPYVW